MVVCLVITHDIEGCAEILQEKWRENSQLEPLRIMTGYLARTWGATATVSVEDLPTAEARLARVRELTGERGADVVFEMSGAPYAFAEGEAGLRDHREDNGYPKVTDELREALVALVRGSPEDHGWARPTWTQELLARQLSQATGVRVSTSTVARTLADVGARWGMARPTVECPWAPAVKGRRVRGIEKLVATLPAGEEAFYEDEVDIHLNPRIGRDWMLPGEQKTVLTPGQNAKHYLAGALHTRTGKVFWVGNG